MTDDDLNELEKLAKAATPGKWWVCYDKSRNYPHIADRKYEAVVEAKGFRETDNDGFWLEAYPFDLEFIAASRTAVPELVAEVRKLREALDCAGRWTERLADKIQHDDDDHPSEGDCDGCKDQYQVGIERDIWQRLLNPTKEP